MIKKVLLFLLLLGGGYFALYSFIDASPKEQEQEPSTTRIDRAPGSSPQEQGQINFATGDNPAVGVIPDGEWRVPGYRLVALPSGDSKELLQYVLKADDSHAEPENKLVLTGVTIDFYSIDFSDPEDPVAVPTSTMVAARARLELSQDENQILHIGEDKLMEFWDVVYTAGEDSVLENLRVTLPHARVLNSADEIHLSTPNQHQPVKITSLGETSFEVTGEGLDARVPTTRGEEGDVDLSSGGFKTIRVLHNPVLVQGSTTLKSRGELRIREDNLTGSALITMTDQVEILQTDDQGRSGTREIQATGGFLEAVMTRGENDDQTVAAWNKIVLTGSPAHLVVGSENDLTCAELAVYPSASGEPYRFTARGDETISPVMNQVIEGKASTFRSSGDVHVIQLVAHHGFYLQAFGIGSAAIPSELEQVVIFEGVTDVEAPADDLEFQASGGLTVIRSDRPELSDYLYLNGRGEVRMSSAEVLATGNKGFSLHQKPPAPGTLGEISREFRLGPSQPDTQHRYEVTRLETDEERFSGIRLAGSGSCSIRMTGRRVDEVHLSSLAEDIDVAMTRDSSRMWQVRTVDAWFDPDGTPTSFIAAGSSCLVTVANKGGTLHGTAEEIHHPGPDTYRLLGSLAEVRHEVYGVIRGRDILAQTLSKTDFRVRARQEARLLVEDMAVGPRETLVSLDLRANEIRAEPFLAPPSVVSTYRDLVPNPGALALQTRLLFADGDVSLAYEVGEGVDLRTGTCIGSELVLRSDREGVLFADGRLLGDPAVLDSVDPRGTRTLAESRRIRFFYEEEAQYLTLDPVEGHEPTLRLISVEENSVLAAPARLQLTSAGRIELGPDQVLCNGPVAVRSLDPSGQVEPMGYSLDARTLTMARTPRGAIASLRATDEVRFRWREAVGTCEELSMDLTTNLLSALGSPAQVQLNNQRFSVSRLEYNYQTKMVECWYGQLKRKKVITSR